MTRWYYEKHELKNTPSFRDGITYDTECRYRREGARFIINLGKEMNLGNIITVATGVVYFHRFYMFHSFATFPRYLTACGCLFLAGKVEETPKKCKDIVKTASMLLSKELFKTLGEFPVEEVMTIERILLQTIKFDLQVDHPYTYLVKYAKCLKGNKKQRDKMVNSAWILANDSLCTTLSLQWEPEIIAVACLNLGGKFNKFKVTNWEGRMSSHANWWDAFIQDITKDILEDIGHQILDLLQPDLEQKPVQSTQIAKSSESLEEKNSIQAATHCLTRSGLVPTNPVTKHEDNSNVSSYKFISRPKDPNTFVPLSSSSSSVNLSIPPPLIVDPNYPGSFNVDLPASYGSSKMPFQSAQSPFKRHLVNQGLLNDNSVNLHSGYYNSSL